jgi:hypothetical protein
MMQQQNLVFVIAVVIVAIASIAYIKKSKNLLNIAILATVILSALVLLQIISKHSPRLLSLGALTSPPFPTGPNSAIMKVRVDDSHVLFIKRAGTSTWTQVTPQSATAGGLNNSTIETEYDFIDTSGLSAGDVIRIDCYNGGTTNNPAGLFFYIQFIQNSPYGTIPDILSNASTVFLDEALTTSAVAVTGSSGAWNLSDPISVAKIAKGGSWVWNTGCVNCNSPPNPPPATPITFYIPITPTTATNTNVLPSSEWWLVLENSQTGNRIETGGSYTGGGNTATYSNDMSNNKQWAYNQSTLTLCSMQTGNCLENGGGSSGGHLVKALIGDDGSNNKKWAYDYRKSTFCNQQTGQCLENGGANTGGNILGAYGDDGTCSKKWIIKQISQRPSSSNFTLVSTTPTNASGVLGNAIRQGTTLTQGQGFKSPDGGHMFVIQSDGNVCIYNTFSGVGTWCTMTNGKGTPPITFVYQNDGNLVVYDSTNKAYWASNTGKASAYLTMQNDGNLVLYNSGMGAVWNTGTNGK